MEIALMFVGISALSVVVVVTLAEWLSKSEGRRSVSSIIGWTLVTSFIAGSLILLLFAVVI